MKKHKFPVTLRDSVFGTQDSELGRVLKRMLQKTQHEQTTAQGLKTEQTLNQASHYLPQQYHHNMLHVSNTQSNKVHII